MKNNNNNKKLLRLDNKYGFPLIRMENKNYFMWIKYYILVIFS